MIIFRLPILSAPKKLPFFFPTLPGFTSSEDDRESEVSCRASKAPDQEFFADVRSSNSWEKIAESYEFVLSDIPIDSNLSSAGPYYG